MSNQPLFYKLFRGFKTGLTFQFELKSFTFVFSVVLWVHIFVFNILFFILLFLSLLFFVASDKYTKHTALDKNYFCKRKSRKCEKKNKTSRYNILNNEQDGCKNEWIWR